MKPITWFEDRADSLSLPGVSTGLLARGVLLLAVGLLIWVGLWQLSTPDVAPASTETTAFSAARANDHLQVIATESRAVGSPGHLAAQEYITAQIRALGLEPQLQTAPAQVRFEGADSFSAGTVNNIVARLPGTDNTGAIVVNAHYDSGTTGPGASDCGSCVVTSLESMRAIVAGPALRNDIIFVFSDAEENGDLGAAGFVQEHPWAEDVSLALNYESQGSGGPAFLYATSEDDGWIVAEFLDVAPNVSAYSWMGAISDLMPGAQLETDLAEYMKGGIQGLGFVYVANTTDYHTVTDSIKNIDLGSIQQEGDYTVAFVHHFGNLDLTDPPRENDRVFFNILPGIVVDYSSVWVLPLAGLITVLTVVLLVVGFRKHRLQAGRLALSATFLGLGTLIAITLSVLTWIVIRTLNSDYQVTLIGNYQSDLYTVAFILLTIAMMSALYVLLRRLGTENLLAGVLVIWLPLLWLMSLAVPAMSYIATWPLLFAIVPLGWMLLGGNRANNPWLKVAFLSIAAIPAIILLPGTLYQVVGLFNRFEGAAGLPIFGLTMLFVAPIVLLLMPHFDMLAGKDGKDRWVIPLGAALLAVVLIGWGNVTSGFNADQPRPDHMSYVLNADTGQAQWVSFDRNLDSWTGEFIPKDAEQRDYETVTWGTFQAYTADAPFVAIPEPEVIVENETVTGDLRTLDIRLSSPRGAPEMRIRIDAPGEIVAAVLDGRALDLSEYQWAADGLLKFTYINVPEHGFELTLDVKSIEPVSVTVEDSAVDLPDSPILIIPPRPADAMPAPLYRRDSTDVLKTYDI